jgi:septal ring factor EnvC (AmiA/AmiB activator)
MYAPSFAPGSSASEADHAYTASTLAKFLGRMYCKENKGNIEQQNSVKAALGSLELIERKVPGYSLASTKNISLVKLIKANSEIKDKHERAQARQKKTAEELTKKNEEIAENTRKADEAEVELKQAKLAQKKAEREVKKASTKAKAKRLRKKASEARDKAERNKENIEEHGEKLEEDVAKVHAKEEEQKAEDEYEAIRRSMRDRIRAIQMIGKDEHEDKSLGVRDLKEKDREIVR